METNAAHTGEGQGARLHTALYHELSAIASVELSDVLAAWGSLSTDQATRLSAYLSAELAEGGLLSLSHLRDGGADAGTIRRQARRLT